MFWLRYQPDIWRYYAWNRTIRTLPVPCFWCTIPSTVFMPRLSHSICSTVTPPCPWAGQEDHGAEEEERQQCIEAGAVPGMGALCHPPPPVQPGTDEVKGRHDHTNLCHVLSTNPATCSTHGASYKGTMRCLNTISDTQTLCSQETPEAKGFCLTESLTRHILTLLCCTWRFLWTMNTKNREYSV